MQNFNNYSNLQTPCYILDENRLMKNFSDLKSAFENAWKNNFIIGYSFKTNSLPYILTWMRSHGSYAEVVSEAEYKLALKTGFSSDKVILNGPVKGENAILEVVKKILENNPQSIIDYKAGKDRALGFLVGQAMKETKGKANPKMLNEMFLEELKK